LILERLKYFFFHVNNDWQIGLIQTDLNTFLFSNLSPKIKWIKCDFDVYQADPFGFEKDGNLYVFYEEYLKKQSYAILKCSIYDSDLNKKGDRIILDDGTHKSFPFCFIDDTNHYLMPESGALNKLIIYESLDFPFSWGNEKVILNFACSDAILKKIENKWYLFYTKSNEENENGILYMRLSADLFGDWEAQEEYIVKKDLYNSRNAGDIYKINDTYYRFAQNCLNQYGENIIVNKIEFIDNRDIEESFCLEKNLYTKNNGFHTLNGTQNFVLIDRRINRLKPKSIKLILQQLLKRISNKNETRK